MTDYSQGSASSAIQETDRETPFVGTYDGPPVNGMVSVTYSAWVRILAELGRMVPFVGDAAANGVLRKVRSSAGELLHRIEGEIMNGVIQPWSPIRLTQDAPVPPLSGNTSKIGIYPVTANPFQWCHLLAGLSAIGELGLDHVIYILTDEGASKERLLPRETRQAMSRDLLARFSPLLLYSPLSPGKDEDGMTAVFRLLKLNARQPMAVYYLAGCAGDGESIGSESVLDALVTAAKNKREEYDGWMHPLTAVFFGKKRAAERPESAVKSAVIDFPLPSVIPGGFPAALKGGDGKETLATLPFTVFRNVRRLWTTTEARKA